MRALTLHQPWASLVAHGFKMIETRSWYSGHRGPLVIHAAKALPLNWTPFQAAPFVEALEPLVGVNEYGSPNLDRLPLGCVLAVVNMKDCVRMSQPITRGPLGPTYGRPGPMDYSVSERERAFGHYALGRYAWIFDGIVWLPQEPVPCRGRQRLWECSLDELALA